MQILWLGSLVWGLLAVPSWAQTARVEPLQVKLSVSQVPLPAPGEVQFQRPTAPAAASAQYLVYVPEASAALLSRVRALAPDAFATQLGGQSVIQVGRFEREGNARNLQQALTQVGVTAQLLSLNRVGVRVDQPGGVTPDPAAEPLPTAPPAQVCAQGLVINGSPGQVVQVVVLPSGAGESVVRQFSLGPQTALRC